MNAETASPAPSNGPRRRISPLVWTALLLAALLAILFRQSFDTRYVAFSNDGPLGVVRAEETRMPATMFSLWVDLNWLGSDGLSPPPGITSAMRCLTTPVGYLNILYPASLFIVGIAACYCLRQFKLSPMACILGGLAAGLNSDFFSTCCWGVASQIVGFGAIYFALGLLAASAVSPRHRWLRLMLAGLAVGMGVMEAYDIGGFIFSPFVAAFVLYQALFLTDEGDKKSTPVKRLGNGALRMVVVTGFAIFISLHTLAMLWSTQIHGVVGTGQDKETKEKHWDVATQWSLPKVEIAQLFVPGMFGNRMESTNGDNYWGQIGRSPTIDPILKQRDEGDAQTKAQLDAYLKNSNLWRFSGTGLYAGALVLVVALWAALQSFRKTGSPYSRSQRRAIWFWVGILVVTVLLSFGRYGPFYQFYYALPFTSTMRNPVKFMHAFMWALIIIFGYGVDGLYRVYMHEAIERKNGWWAEFKKWFAAATTFEKGWLLGSCVAFALAVAGWAVYAALNDRLRDYIASIGIDPIIAPIDAKFSLHAVGWFVLFLAAALGLLALIFAGVFAGSRAKWGGALLATLLVAELIHADAPWPRYWDIAYKYASNPIVDLLQEKPWEHRVALNPIGQHGNQQFDLFQQVYTIEWQQQVFPYYDIQSLETVMEPRVPVDKDMFQRAIPADTPANVKRLWELTNTRYVVGFGGGVLDFLNQQVDPVAKRFHLARSFNLTTKPGKSGIALADYTAETNLNGQLALIEFTGALPRASLFAKWTVNTNDDATLMTLANPQIDPHQIVLVATNLPAPGPLSSNSPGSVEITDYKSTRIEFSADVKAPCVMLLVDRYSPKWQAEVDGEAVPVLRCDFILRGIYLEPGKHKIVMRYVTPLITLYVSFAAIFLGLVLCGILIFGGRDTDALTAELTNRSDDAETSKAP